jgi:hypothetical protein
MLVGSRFVKVGELSIEQTWRKEVADPLGQTGADNATVGL